MVNVKHYSLDQNKSFQVFCCDLTQPPSAHVVQLSAEEESGQNVDHWENDPEDCISFPKYLQTDRHKH